MKTILRWLRMIRFRLVTKRYRLAPGLWLEVARDMDDRAVRRLLHNYVYKRMKERST